MSESQLEQKTTAVLASVNQQMLKTFEDDWLQLVNCSNHWPLVKEHSGSNNSINWTDLDQHRHRLFLTAELFLLSWKRLLDIRICQRHMVDSRLGGETNNVAYTAWPRLLGLFLFNLPWMEMVSALTHPDLERMILFFFLFYRNAQFFRNIDLKTHCKGTSGIRFSVVMSLLHYLW